MNRQSKDFKEIVNLQTDMNTTNEKWDKIFHNWDNPIECNGRKKIPKCSICEKLDNGETVMHNNREYKIE